MVWEIKGCDNKEKSIIPLRCICWWWQSIEGEKKSLPRSEAESSLEDSDHKEAAECESTLEQTLLPNTQ